MLIHFKNGYCLTGQSITLTARSVYAQVLEKVGQIALTPFLIEIRFEAWLQRIWQAQSINNSSQTRFHIQRRSETDAT
jgi:hypothetical protein